VRILRTEADDVEGGEVFIVHNMSKLGVGGSATNPQFRQLNEERPLGRQSSTKSAGERVVDARLPPRCGGGCRAAGFLHLHLVLLFVLLCFDAMFAPGYLLRLVHAVCSPIKLGQN
jgi:hypothetical protein